MTISDRTKRHLETCYHTAECALFVYSVLEAFEARTDQDQAAFQYEWDLRSPYRHKKTLTHLQELYDDNIISFDLEEFEHLQRCAGDRLPPINLYSPEGTIRKHLGECINTAYEAMPHDLLSPARQQAAFSNLLYKQQEEFGRFEFSATPEMMDSPILLRLNPYLALMLLKLSGSLLKLRFHCQFFAPKEENVTVELEAIDKDFELYEYHIELPDVQRNIPKLMGDFTLHYDGDVRFVTYKQKDLSQFISSKKAANVEHCKIIMGLLLENLGKPVSVTQIAESLGFYDGGIQIHSDRKRENMTKNLSALRTANFGEGFKLSRQTQNRVILNLE